MQIIWYFMYIRYILGLMLFSNNLLKYICNILNVNSLVVLKSMYLIFHSHNIKFKICCFPPTPTQLLKVLQNIYLFILKYLYALQIFLPSSRLPFFFFFFNGFFFFFKVFIFIFISVCQWFPLLCKSF